MRSEKREIYNGVELNYYFSTKFKVNVISIDFILNFDTESAAALSLLPHVLKRGTSSMHTRREIARKLDELYGASVVCSSEKKGDNHVIGFTLSCLKSEFCNNKIIDAELIGVVNEMLNDPYRSGGKLSGEYIESEKCNMLDRIRSDINNKNRYAVKRCIEELLGGKENAPSVLGTPEQVSRIDADDLEKARVKLLSGSHVEVYYSGNTDIETIADALKKIFADDRTPFRVIPQKVIMPANDEVRRITETVSAEQGKLCLGFFTGSCSDTEKNIVKSVFLSVLGSSPCFKLFMNVREKKSLCYYVYPVSRMFGNLVVITAGIDNGNAEITERAIMDEIRNVIDGNISNDEFDTAIRSIVTEIKSAGDDPLFCKYWYGSRLFGTYICEPEEYISLLNGITVGQIGKIASELKLSTVYFLRGEAGPNED